MSPIPTVLPYTRAQLAGHIPADRLTLLAERLMAAAETLRGMAHAIARATWILARVAWFYRVENARHRALDLESAVLAAFATTRSTPDLEI